MAETVVDTFITRFLFKKDRAQLRGLERQIGSIRQKLDGMSRGFSIAGGIITGALVGTARPLDDFSKSINRLERDLQPTNEQLALLKAQAIEIGNNARYTTINVEDVINAQRELGKAGLTVNEVMSLTPKIMDLVAATELDVADAASRGVKLMSAFGLTVADMGPLFDRMAWTAVNANTTFDQLLNGVSRIGPTARVAGYDVQEMVAAFAMLNAINIQPERAETGLRQFMIKLGDLDKLPEDAIKALKELDITLDELKFMKGQGDFLGLLELFKERGAGIMEISRAFGSEAAPIILGLMENVAQAGALMADATEESAGQVVDQAVIMNKGFSGALAAMRSSYQTAIIALGDAGLNDILIEYVTRIRSVTEAFMELDGETKRLVVTGLAMGPVLLGIGGLFKGLSILLGGFMPLVKGVSLVLSGLLTLGGLTMIAKLAGGLALIAGALWALGFDWEDLSKRLEGTWLGKILAGDTSVAGGELLVPLIQQARSLYDELSRDVTKYVRVKLEDDAFSLLDASLEKASSGFWELDERLKTLENRVFDWILNIRVEEAKEQARSFFEEFDRLTMRFEAAFVNHLVGADWDRFFDSFYWKWTFGLLPRLRRALVEAIFGISWGDVLDAFANPTAPSMPGSAGALRGEGVYTVPYGPELPPDRERTIGDMLGITRPGSEAPYGPELPPSPIIQNLMSPPAAPPVLPATPGTAAGQHGSPAPRQTQVTVEPGAIVINTQNGDPETIRGALESGLGNIFSNVAEDFDGNVDR